MTGRTIEAVMVGEVAELSRTITREVIQEFVAASGDDNPIHSDQRFAATTRFGRIIAPGMLTGGLLSAVIGTRLPGPGVIYLSQSFRFLRPVYVGDTVTARVEVTEVERERNRLGLRTVCVNQDGERVLEGEAIVMPSRVRVDYQATHAARPGWALAYAPAVLGAQILSLWMTAGLAVTRHAFGLHGPGPGPSLPGPTR